MELTFEEGRLLWEAKGWDLERLSDEIAAFVKDKPDLKKFEYSASTLQRRSVTDRYMPRPISELIEALKVHPGREHLTEIVETGLRVVHGERISRKVNPKELAQELAQCFPADDFAQRLANALATLAPTTPGLDVDQLAVALSAKLSQPDVDQLAEALSARLPKPPGLDVDQLAGALSAKLPKPNVDALLASVTHRLTRAAWIAAGFIVAVLGLFLLLGQRTPQSPAVVVLNGIADLRFIEPPLVLWTGEAIEMGKRRLTLPDRPFKGQAKPPCNAADHEVELGGGCWVKLAASAPCGAKAYEHAGSCYIPVFVGLPTPQSAREHAPQ